MPALPAVIRKGGRGERGERKEDGLPQHPQRCHLFIPYLRCLRGGRDRLCWIDPLLCVTGSLCHACCVGTEADLSSLSLSASSPGAKDNLGSVNGLCALCRQHSGCGFLKPIDHRDNAPVVNTSGVCLRVSTWPPSRVPPRPSHSSNYPRFLYLTYKSRPPVYSTDVLRVWNQ